MASGHKRKAQALIRLHVRAVWSGPALSAWIHNIILTSAKETEADLRLRCSDISPLPNPTDPFHVYSLSNRLCEESIRTGMRCTYCFNRTIFIFCTTVIDSNFCCQQKQYALISRQRHICSRDIDWLCWGLTTRQPLRVILCRLPEKGRKEIEERVEEMKERDREERGTGMEVKKQKK